MLQVDLAETVSLAEGDAFETVEGRLIAVRAAAEPLAEVAAEGVALARLAWHVGNRHAPAQIGDGLPAGSGATMCSRRCWRGWARRSGR